MDPVSAGITAGSNALNTIGNVLIAKDERRHKEKQQERGFLHELKMLRERLALERDLNIMALQQKAADSALQGKIAKAKLIGDAYNSAANNALVGGKLESSALANMAQLLTGIAGERQSL